MVRCKSLVTALCLLGILLFVPKPAFAIVEAIYYWYDTGGTAIDDRGDISVIGDETSWTVGNVSGTVLAGLKEFYDSSANEFKYVIENLRSDRAIYHITNWELHNPYAIIATSLVGGPISTSWGVVTSPDKWTWSTPVWGQGANGAGDIDNFKVYTPAPRGLVTGKVYFYNSSGTAPASNPTASGIVSGPVPEPTSLLLLGSGLLGVALLGVRKRKI